MLRREIVDGLHLRVDEAEGEPGIRIDAFDQVVEIAASHRRQPRALAASNRPFAQHEGARPAQACTSTKLIAAAFASGQIDLRAETTTRTLGITTWQQCDTAQC